MARAAAAHDPASRRLKIAVVGFFAATLVAKAVIASRLDLFGDEAFYWECSKRLDWGFSDLPPLASVLVRFGTSLFGDTPFGVRAPFVVLGALVAPAMFLFARPVVGERRAWMATGLSMLSPLVGGAGVVAVPDVVLLVATAWALAAFERATRTGSLLMWIGAGLCCALGFSAHYRAGMIVAGAAAWLFATRAGRERLRRPGPWIALVVALAGLLPSLIFNVRNGFASMRFQFLERHEMSAPGPKQWLVHPVEQALAVTPILYAVVLVALVDGLRRARRGDERAGLLVAFAVVPIAVYFLASPVLGAELSHFHWLAPSYLPLYVLLPRTLEDLAARGGWRRIVAVLAPATAGAATVVGAVATTTTWSVMDPVLRPFRGWTETAADVRARLPRAAEGARPIVVADSYLQAAQVDFQLDGEADVYALDHPRNARQGRAVQIALWGVDERGLKKRAGRDALVVVERSDFPAPDRAAWFDHVASLFESMEQVDVVRVRTGGKPRELVFLTGRRIRS
jgi:4-amino-4-deoxy-L-arabinose transferase-like glycosyltransferase